MFCKKCCHVNNFYSRVQNIQKTPLPAPHLSWFTVDREGGYNVGHLNHIDYLRLDHEIHIRDMKDWWLNLLENAATHFPLGSKVPSERFKGKRILLPNKLGPKSAVYVCVLQDHRFAGTVEAQLSIHFVETRGSAQNTQQEV